MKAKFLKMVAVGFVVCLLLLPTAVQAGFVNDSNSSNDPRYMTTGCRYGESLKSGGSIGIWVKNISSYIQGGASIFGSCHINSGSSDDQGLLLYINSSGNLTFRVAGEKSGEIVRQSITADGSAEMLNDGSWHFLFGSFDVSTGSMSFYVDGRLVDTVHIDIKSLVSSRCFTVAAIGYREGVNRLQAARRRNLAGGYDDVLHWA